MSAVPSAVFRKMSFPHNGKIITIDQLTYHEPNSQTSPETTISSVANKQTFNSSLLGNFPGLPPPPITDPSLSNVCMMQSSQDILKQPASASQQPHPRPPQPAPSDSSQPAGPPPSGPSPTACIPEPLYPPGSVPSGLNHLRAIPPGHYPAGQIPFVDPPPGVYSVPVMATLSLPNLTLGIPVWYLDPPAATHPGHPKPYMALTPVQPVSLTFSVTTGPPAPPQDPSPIVMAPGKKGKTRKGAPKDKTTPTDPAPPPPAKPYALCDVFGHATHACPELPRIQPMVKVTFPESTVPEASIPSSSVTKNPKTLHTNKPCALCGIHGHYSHHCPHLTHYYTSLEVV